MSERRVAWSRAGCLLLALGLFLQGCSREQPRDEESTSPPMTRTPMPATVRPEIWPVPPSPAIDDAALEGRLNELLSALTIEEKVGQIIQADITSVTPQDVRKYRLGSVLNGGNSGPGGDDLAPPQRWLEAADAFYAASMDPRIGGTRIPILWAVDAVHGHNNIVGATLFPHNIALGATRNPELLRRIGEITAREIRTTGQDWTFAPSLAVARDARWGRSYESYSQDPQLVREYATAIVQGLQGEPGSPEFLRGEHVIATAKHFIGDGGTFEGRDQGDTRASEEELRDVHGAAYSAAITAGVQTIMASFSSWQGAKIHGHKGLLTDVLKHRMGFEGFIVGDWNAHAQLADCSSVSCPAAINAGLDMFMAPTDWRELYASTLKQVRSGEIPMARLDDAVRRILRVKLRAGLFDAGKPSSRPLAGRFELLGAPEHRRVARQAVRESLVLLKNEKQLLPLRPQANVLVAGDGADSIAKQSGGWSLTWQGTGVGNEHFPRADSIFAGIRTAVRAAGGEATLSVDGSYQTKPDVAIVVFGEDPYAEFQGDVETLEYKPGNKADLELLRKLRADGIPIVSVFLSGRPLWVNPEINASDAFVAAWLPGSEGAGVADLLFRSPDGAVAYDFKGRLPFAWPRTPLQVASDEANPPLFAYGFGLTYQQTGDLPTLSEEIPPEAALATSARALFTNGRIAAGLKSIASEGATRVELVDARGTSPRKVVQVSPIDGRAQEDARLIAWSGGRSGSFSLQSDVAMDLQRESNGQLSLAFDYRVDARPGARVELAIECGPDCRASVPIERVLRVRTGEWRTIKVPLKCFENRGARMGAITAPFVLSTAGALKLAITNVRLEGGVDDVLACE